MAPPDHARGQTSPNRNLILWFDHAERCRTQTSCARRTAARERRRSTGIDAGVRPVTELADASDVGRPDPGTSPRSLRALSTRTDVDAWSRFEGVTFSWEELL